MTDPLLTINEAAHFLSVDPRTVRRMISRGQLKAKRYGRSIRIAPSDLAKAGKPIARTAYLLTHQTEPA